MGSLSSTSLTNFTNRDSTTPTQQLSSGKNTSVAEIIRHGIPGLVVGAVIGLVIFGITHQLGKYYVQRRRVARAIRADLESGSATHPHL